MIDLHCHILPGVDDGAASEEESCMMARTAVESGVSAIAATPHCNVPNQFDNYPDADLAGRFRRFSQMLRQQEIPLTVYPGMEVYVTADLPALIEKRKILTLAGSRYLLIEFGFDAPAIFMHDMLHAVMSLGLVPVIAHPERYYCVQDEHELLFRWAEQGSVLQINKGSLFGMFGRHAAQTAYWSLAEGCVHLVGSDAHSPFRRTPRLEEARDCISQFNCPEIADFLLQDNPQHIINNDPVQPVFAEF